MLKGFCFFRSIVLVRIYVGLSFCCFNGPLHQSFEDVTLSRPVAGLVLARGIRDPLVTLTSLKYLPYLELCICQYCSSDNKPRMYIFGGFTGIILDDVIEYIPGNVHGYMYISLIQRPCLGRVFDDNSGILFLIFP